MFPYVRTYENICTLHMFTLHVSGGSVPGMHAARDAQLERDVQADTCGHVHRVQVVHHATTTT